MPKCAYIEKAGTLGHLIGTFLQEINLFCFYEMQQNIFKHLEI